MKLSHGLLALPLWCGCSLPSARTPEAPDPNHANMKSTQALLVLDMQNDFCHPEGKMHALVRDELERTDLVESTVRLVRAAQARGVVTFVAPIEFDYSRPGPSAPEGIMAPIAAARAFDKDGFGGELFSDIARLTHAVDVIEMPKPALSAFAGTALHEMLQERGVEEVVIAGLLTNYCVENTARDAFDRGYRVRVISDATATFDAAQQDHAVENVFPMLGRTLTVAEFSAP